MEARHRKPGSVRLNEEQYAEMDRLGFTSESAYVKYKMQQGQSKLEVLKTTSENDTIRQLPADGMSRRGSAEVENKLTIQRLSIENRKLQEKLEEVSKSSQETLNGVHHKVHSMLQEELQKRDFEELKESFAKSKKEIDKLEKDLSESKKETEIKQEEIETLVKKLGFVELGKVLLPSAISVLAKQYPNQMKGIAGTLGRLGISDAPENIDKEEDQDYLIQILNHLTEVFTEEQFEQVIQLMLQLGGQIKDDQGLLQKIGYYLNQLQEKKSQNKKEA
ncbi:hypothetical protein D1818_11030 [Aquimarina sp. BL5]|uniref:hypothetical protein n=1 Tax=Aquimarina sp. BL5 TaxID=1714860 RepID=UPI000E554523|nr:hypothetical protein [Aquimarina sp. BL5]AXT51339.1 hypothetical protein D1818_11030 [Aquimarina sp. BL5]RKN09871.1 hypothetical protein D7036_03620 [Aquimarina sp. BL5]